MYSLQVNLWFVFTMPGASLAANKSFFSQQAAATQINKEDQQIEVLQPSFSPCTASQDAHPANARSKDHGK